METKLRTFMFKGVEQTQTTLIASKGMVLTQKELQGDDGRIYSTMIFLGKNDCADNYIEITELVAEEMQKIEEEKRLKEADNGKS